MHYDDLSELDLASIDAAVDSHHAVDAAARRLGVASVRPWQRMAVSLWSQRRDCLILSGTGSGKSLCFQLPPLVSGSTALVVSPLISLMRDQVAALKSCSVRAVFLGSGQEEATAERSALAGEMDLVYTCPETLLRLLPGLSALHERRPLSVIAIDEAHCIAAWGHDFRPSYARLAGVRAALRTL